VCLKPTKPLYSKVETVIRFLTLPCESTTSLPTILTKNLAAIASSRSKNSPAIISRGHQIDGVYIGNEEATDIVVLGKFELNLKDGNSVSTEFTARFVVRGQEGDAKLESVRVWTDPTEMKKALEGLGQGKEEK
jgi:hypothetical protein